MLSIVREKVSKSIDVREILISQRRNNDNCEFLNIANVKLYLLFILLIATSIGKKSKINDNRSVIMIKLVNYKQI